MDIWIAENYWWIERQTDEEVIYVVVLNVCLSVKKGRSDQITLQWYWNGTNFKLYYILSNSIYFHLGNRYKP